MATADQLKAKAKLMTHADVVALWDLVSNGQPTPGWDKGKALEYLFLQAFELEKVEVDWPYNVKLPQVAKIAEQMDGAIHHKGVSYLVECKDEGGIDIAPLAKLRFRLERRPPGCMGLLVSVGDFTPAARLFTQFASPLNVLLWGHDDVDYAIRNSKMIEALDEKYRRAILDGLPDFETGA